MNTLGERFLLRLRLLVLSLGVGAASSTLALLLVALWVSGLELLAIFAGLVWFVATLPWLIFAAAVAADIGFLVIARGTVFVPTMLRVVRSVEREREIMRRPEPPVSWVSKAAFFTNPLMPLAMATATFLESRPVLESVVASLHDSIMMAPRRAPVVRISTDWNDHRLRDAAA